MDDKQFLPEYPEGVSWLMKDPTAEPEVCPFWNKWHDLPVDEDGEQEQHGSGDAQQQHDSSDEETGDHSESGDVVEDGVVESKEGNEVEVPPPKKKRIEDMTLFEITWKDVSFIINEEGKHTAVCKHTLITYTYYTHTHSR